MKKLNLFIPITKVDEENRLVYGVLAAEEVDNSGEIFDYESSKPNFEKWSDGQFEASNGLSKGNVRAMHTSIAAGKLTDISYDDDAKIIEGCAKVVDDGEWQKVLEGVYTGFSMGGRYEKRWNDNGQMRYTALPVEMSLVDKPCIKSALFAGLSKTFMLQKADGTLEQRAFQTDLAKEWDESNVERDEHGRFAGGGGGSGSGDPYGDSLGNTEGQGSGHNSGDEEGDAFEGHYDDEGEYVELPSGYGGTVSEDGSRVYLTGPGGADLGVFEGTQSAGEYAAEHAAGHGGSDPTGHGGDNAKATVTGPDGKSYASGTTFHTIDGNIHAISPQNNVPKAAWGKSDKGDTIMFVPTNDQILPVAQALAKAAGKTDADWLEYVEPATAQLVAEHGGGTVAKADEMENAAAPEHTDADCKVDNCDKCAAAKADTGTTTTDVSTGEQGVAKAAGGPDEGDHSGEGDQEPAASVDETAAKSDTPAEPVQGWQASDGTFFAKKADCAAHNAKLAKGDVAPSLTELLDGALAVAKGDVVVPEAVVEDQPLGKSIDTQLLELAAFIDGPDLRKGLYDVSSLTTTLRYAAQAYSSSRNETAREGDGSTVPAQLLEATEKLGQALIDMATEEVGEMLTELREAGESDDNWVYPECCYLSASTMGLEKADADVFFTKALGAVEKRGPRLGKGVILGQPGQTEDDLSKAVKAAGFDSADAFVAGIADLQKKAGELAEIAPKVEELTKFVTELKAKPMPKAPTTSLAVEKSIDAGGNGGTTVSGDSPLAKAEAALAGLNNEDIAKLAIKMSHASGGVRLSLNQ